MASLLERLLRRASQRARDLDAKERPAGEPDVESIEAALADAEELAARTNALARDLHRLLARGIQRRRDARKTERVLH
jgi:hypothetical protein